MPTRRALAKPALLLALVAGACSAVYLWRLADSCWITAPREVEVIRGPQNADGPAWLYRNNGGSIEYYAPATACTHHGIPLADGEFVDLWQLLSGTQLEVGCDLRGVEWAGVNLAGVSLRRCDLRWANLRGACLRGAHLEGANLIGADLSEADLRGSGLTDATLVRAWSSLDHSTEFNPPIEVLVRSFQDARYDRFTRWPRGFRPAEHGAKLVE